LNTFLNAQKLALVVAAAWQQAGDHAAARRFMDLAKKWGCDKKLMAQLLVAGVHNTLRSRRDSQQGRAKG